MYNNNKFNEVTICIRRYIKDFRLNYGKANVIHVVSNVNT